MSSIEESLFDRLRTVDRRVWYPTSHFPWCSAIWCPRFWICLMKSSSPTASMTDRRRFLLVRIETPGARKIKILQRVDAALISQRLNMELVKSVLH